MAMPLALRLAARELRGGLTGFRVFIAALALGVGAIAAVGSLSASVITELQNNARAMLGGDAEVNLTARAADDAELSYFLSTADKVSTVRDLRSMARNTDGTVMLVELKGVDDLYPLFGQMALTPSQDIAAALAIRDGVPGAAAEAELFSRLGLAIGDRVVIGNVDVELRAVIGATVDGVHRNLGRVGVGAHGVTCRNQIPICLGPRRRSCRVAGRFERRVPQGRVAGQRIHIAPTSLADVC